MIQSPCTTQWYFEGAFSAFYLDVTRIDEGKPNWRDELSMSLQSLDGCHYLGGRYWNVRLDLPINTSRFVEWNICAPSACSPMRIKKFLAPVYETPGFPDLNIARASFWELASWQDAKVSWAIIGIGSDRGYGGTSSLAYNLHQHPQLELLYLNETLVEGNYEEHFFMYQRQRYLPLVTEIDAFNTFRTKWDNDHFQRRPLRGIKRGSYMWSDAALARMKLVKGLRVIVVLSDPVEVFDRCFIKCVTEFLELGSPYQGTSLNPSAMFANCSVVPHWLRSQPRKHVAALTHRLQEIVATFGSDKVFIAHKMLLNSGHAYWDNIASFLGADPFPSSMLFTKIHASRSDPNALKLVLDTVLSFPHACRHYKAFRAIVEAAVELSRPSLLQLIKGLDHSPLAVLPTWLTEGKHEHDSGLCARYVD